MNKFKICLAHGDMRLLATKRVPIPFHLFFYYFYISFNGMHALADLDCKFGGAKWGRDTEGTENRDTHSNMATRGLVILGRGHGPWAP